MLTPVDIQNKNFKGGIGFDKKDVENFMNEISSDYSELYRSNVELKDKVNTLNESLQHYKTIEDSMQKALTISEKTSEETISAANDKARQITNEAELKAESILADAKQELEDTKNEIFRLQQQQKTFKEQFTKILNAQLKLMDGEIVDIDLGAGFEANPSYFSGGASSEGGLGTEGGLSGGGGYTGSNPSNFERANQDPTFERSSLNMDPFSDAGSGGRFSRQTGGSYNGASGSKSSKSDLTKKNTEKSSLNIKNAEPKSTKIHRVPSSAMTSKPAEHETNIRIDNNTVSSSVSHVSSSEAVQSVNVQKPTTNINESSKPALQSAMAQRLAAKQSAQEQLNNKPVTGDVENKINESNMIDSEDNYNTGFDFVDEAEGNSFNTSNTFEAKETLSGDVESKINESNMIDSEDNYNTGFDFVEETDDTQYTADNSFSTVSTFDDEETLSGEVESRVNESNMIDSEDNYNTGFDFVVGNEDEEEGIPTILSDSNNVHQTLNNNVYDEDVFVGDVEDKLNESHLIGNEDDDNEGFNFL